jgi:uncharacterized membrane protein
MRGKSASQPLSRWRDSTAPLGGRELHNLVRTPAGRILVGAVGAIALLTVIGVFALWPRGEDATPSGVASATIPATVQQVIDEPCSPGAAEVCRRIVVEVEGREVTLGLNLTRIAPAVEVGDSVRVTRPGGPDARPASGRTIPYEFAGVDRRTPLLWIALVVAVLAAALLRWRGVLAVAGAGLSLAVLIWFLVPAILSGSPALLVGLVASLAVMFVTLVLTNGLGAQTLAAALGVSATLAVTCLLGWLTIDLVQLGTSADLELHTLSARDSSLSLPGITLAALLVGALGVLADTAVTQASAVMALRRANAGYDRGRLYREAFTIGRDHLSATIHTLVLAYAGASLPLLLVLHASGVTTTDAINNEAIAGPIVATAVGCLALILAVPLATALASLLVASLPRDTLGDGHSHHH